MSFLKCFLVSFLFCRLSAVVVFLSFILYRNNLLSDCSNFKCACVTYVTYGDKISNEVHYRLVTELASLAQLEKWFPLQGKRAHSLYFFRIHVNRKEEEEGETEQQQQTYQFTKGCNILHRQQVHHLTLTFIICNKYIISTLHLYTYIH